MVLSDMTVLSNCYEIVILIKNVPLHISVSHLPKLLQKNAYDSTSRYLNVSDFTVMEGLQTCVDPLQVGDLPNFIRIWDKNLIGSETWCNHLGGIWWWSFSWTHIWRHVSQNTQVVVVWRNDIPAHCSGSCSFQYLQGWTPQVYSVWHFLDGDIDLLVCISRTSLFGDS